MDNISAKENSCNIARKEGRKFVVLIDQLPTEKSKEIYEMVKNMLESDRRSTQEGFLSGMYEEATDCPIDTTPLFI